MKIKHLIITMAIALSVSIPVTSFAGPETRCYAYHNANDLIYCLQALRRRGTVRTQGMNPSTAHLYTVMHTQAVVPPTVIPGGVVYGTYQPNAISTIANVAASMLGASAWAYNWRHGYVGARGVYGASYLMNYPW